MRVLLISLVMAGLWALLASERLHAAPVLDVQQSHRAPIGLHFETYRDQAHSSWQQALSAYNNNAYQVSQEKVPNFGLDAGGHWMLAELNNSSDEVWLRYLVVDNAWLDDIELYQLDSGYELLTKAVNGDQYPRSFVRNDDVNFVFRLRVPAGQSYLLLRVDTPDPSPIPLRFYSSAEYEKFKDMRMFSYGACLGFILALMAYNFMLFVGLGERSHLSYSVFLMAFVLMAVAYSGYGMKYFYPEATQWAQWSHPIHMIFYGVCGLLFAASFLGLRQKKPIVFRAILSVIVVMVCAVGITYWLDSRALMMKLTFVFAVSYSMAMIALGCFSVISGSKGARYFLLAVIAGALGAASTTLACLGWIPFNEWTFRGVEIGLLIEATLLALALAARFVEVESQNAKMRELAFQDGLTGLSNRRAFSVQSSTLWNSNLRASRPLCVVMLDIDNFKLFNDTYGHGVGDRALQMMGRVLSNQARKGDVTARLGGEEFVVLLPDTHLDEAVQIAERIRVRISEMIIDQAGQQLGITCSLGVAEGRPGDGSITVVVERADTALYESKHQGRNRVTAG